MAYRDLSLAVLAASTMPAIVGCSSTAKPAGTNGMLYVNGDIHSAIYTYDMGSGATNKVVPGSDPFVTPQGTILCKDTTSGDLGEYSADGTMFRTIVKRNIGAPYDVTYDDDFHNPRLSPDGKVVAYEGQFSQARDIYVVDRQTGALLAAPNSPSVGVGFTRPTWTADGRLVVAGDSNNPGLFVSDTSWKNYERFDPSLANSAQPAVSPDGTKVAFILDADLYVIGLDGKGLLQLTKTTDTEAWPSWSPDGGSIVYYNDTSFLVIPASGGDAVDVGAANSNFTTLDSTRDGQMFWQ